MNTNVLIPNDLRSDLKIKARTWNDLVFLGKENLKAIRARWRNDERELGAHIKWLQETADFLVGGPSNIKAMSIVSKRKNHGSFSSRGEFKGKKGSTTFCYCGGCKYGNPTMGKYVTYDECTGEGYEYRLNAVNCVLMARIFHPRKYNWFYQNELCPFFYECKDGNRKIVNSLNQEKKRAIKAKEAVAARIAKLTEAIKEAESKPVFPALRGNDHFSVGARVVTFDIRDGRYAPEVSIVTNGNQPSSIYDGVVVFHNENDRGRNKNLFEVPRKTALILGYDEYNYLVSNYEYSKLWVSTEEEEWARARLCDVLQIK